MKNTVILVLATLVSSNMKYSEESIAPTFVNYPWDRLSQEEQTMNTDYLSRKLRGFNEDQQTEQLIVMLIDPKSCYLPRKQLLSYGKKIIPNLKEIAGKDIYNARSRAEALYILSSFNEFSILALLENDLLLKRKLSAYDKVHKSSEYDFHSQYISLKMQFLAQNNTPESEIAEVLVSMLINGMCNYTVEEKIIAMGEKVTNPLVRLLENTKAPINLRITALRLLRDINDTKTIPFLFDVLCSHTEDIELRTFAAEIIGNIGWHENIYELQSTLIRPEVQNNNSLKISIEDAIASIKARILIKDQKASSAITNPAAQLKSSSQAK